MSKDKGSKNNKKPKADKNAGGKVSSDYKTENKGKKNQSALDVFTPKSDDKTTGEKNKKK